MKTITRRLLRLENGLGLGPETESERRLHARIEEGRRRVADARARGDLPPLDTADNQREDVSGLTVTEILNRGRARVAQSARAAFLKS